MWGIGIDKAKKVVSMTTQKPVRNVSQPLSRKLRTRQSLFRNCRFRGRVYTNTMFGIKSMRGNKTAQIFVTDFGDIQVFPMHSKKDAHQALLRFFRKQAYQHQCTPTMPKNLALQKDLGTLWKNTDILNNHTLNLVPHGRTLPNAILGWLRKKFWRRWRELIPQDFFGALRQNMWLS